MQTIQYVTIDKSKWPTGPWHDEPDKIQYADPDTGLPCLITRNPYVGSLCGYVGVAESHPYFGVNYSDVDLDAHGGVNFSDFCQTDGSEAQRVCHIPSAGESDHIFWFGFDCAHASMDALPGVPYQMFPDVTYRDISYVRAQIKVLAAQLHAVSAL